MISICLLSDAFYGAFAFAQPIRTQQPSERGTEKYSSGIGYTSYLEIRIKGKNRIFLENLFGNWEFGKDWGKVGGFTVDWSSSKDFRKHIWSRSQFRVLPPIPMEPSKPY